MGSVYTDWRALETEQFNKWRGERIERAPAGGPRRRIHGRALYENYVEWFGQVEQTGRIPTTGYGTPVWNLMTESMLGRRLGQVYAKRKANSGVVYDGIVLRE